MAVPAFRFAESFALFSACHQAVSPEGDGKQSAITDILTIVRQKTAAYIGKILIFIFPNDCKTLLTNLKKMSNYI